MNRNCSKNKSPLVEVNLISWAEGRQQAFFLCLFAIHIFNVRLNRENMKKP